MKYFSFVLFLFLSACNSSNLVSIDDTNQDSLDILDSIKNSEYIVSMSTRVIKNHSSRYSLCEYSYHIEFYSHQTGKLEVDKKREDQNNSYLTCGTALKWNDNSSASISAKVTVYGFTSNGWEINSTSNNYSYRDKKGSMHVYVVIDTHLHEIRFEVKE